MAGALAAGVVLSSVYALWIRAAGDLAQEKLSPTDTVEPAGAMHAVVDGLLVVAGEEGGP